MMCCNLLYMCAYMCIGMEVFLYLPLQPSHIVHVWVHVYNYVSFLWCTAFPLCMCEHSCALVCQCVSPLVCPNPSCACEYMYMCMYTMCVCPLMSHQTILHVWTCVYACKHMCPRSKHIKTHTYTRGLGNMRVIDTIAYMHSQMSTQAQKNLEYTGGHRQQHAYIHVWTHMHKRIVAHQGTQTHLHTYPTCMHTQGQRHWRN